MFVKPKLRGFICTTAHPEGCYKNVLEQMNYVESRESIIGPKNVLIIGASTGYGLASRIVAMAGGKANTIGVSYEKAARGKRTASAGWYNTVALEKEARKRDLYATSINGDAFSNEIKVETIQKIKKDLGKIDLVVYSVAAPKRIDPVTGEMYSSVLKPIDKPYTNKSIDIMEGKVEEITIEPATEEEIQHTIKVMGGEDWNLWIDSLVKEDLLSEKAITISYSYIGPEVTQAIYRNGTIGKAKEDLENTVHIINEKLKSVNGKAYVTVAKALVTQASAAIPVVPLYIGSLYKVMKQSGTHEDCIEQIYRLFHDFLYQAEINLDPMGRIRIDDSEMDEETQQKTMKIFEEINNENIHNLIDVKDYKNELLKLYGFSIPGVSYDEDIPVDLKIPSLSIGE